MTAILIFVFVKNGVRPTVAVVASKVVAVPVTSLLFLFYHNFRYGAVETSQVGILMLGLITNTATAAIHSILPAYAIHGSGNLFAKALSEGIWTNEIAMTIVSVLIVFELIALAVLFILDANRD